MKRIILLLDLDYFYAAIEERRNPKIKGKPVIVCVYSGRSKDSGAVATSNYHARKLRIKSGMYIKQAKKLAKKGKDKGKEAVFLPVDMEYYRKVSKRIMVIAKKYSDRFEQVSIDEIYLDISNQAKGNYDIAKKIAQRIRNNIVRKEKVTCSIGIGPNKLIAKMASGENKPDGLTIIKSHQVKSFLKGKKVIDLHGIGKKTAEVLKNIGIKTIEDLQNADHHKLEEMLGENRAKSIQEHAHGYDNDPVMEEAKKQISRIITLKKDSDNFEYINKKIPRLSESIFRLLHARKAAFRTISILAISKGLQMRTKSISLTEPSIAKKDIIDSSRLLLKEFLKEKPGKIRRFGVRISGFSELDKGQKEQKRLFEFGKKQ